MLQINDSEDAYSISPIFTFILSNEDDGFVAATLHDDGIFHVVLQDVGEWFRSIQIDPTIALSYHLSELVQNELSDHSVHGVLH